MHKSILLAVSLLAMPVVAQVSGSINRNAPTVTRSIEYKNGNMLMVKYTAISFGEGAWQGILKNKDRHERFNAGAARRPIGSIKTTVAATASGREIPAGSYKMFFTVHEQAGFLLNLQNVNDDDAKPIVWRMAMSDAKTKSTRFDVSLDPGDKVNSASITFTFGAKTVRVPLKLGGKKKAEKSGIR